MFKLSFKTTKRKVMAIACCAALTVTTFAAESDVVINEVMYHPPLDRDDLQYIELYNRGDAANDLSRWSFTKGIKFLFPEGTRLAPGGYLVVCANQTQFASHYGANLPVAGNFSGKLSHHGEKIELSNATGKAIDAVEYADHKPWPTGADGYSASLERICPGMAGKDPANWAASQLPLTQKPAGTPGRRNDNFSTNLPPIISSVQFKPPSPGQKANVTTEVMDAAGVKTVTLLWRIIRSGNETPETEVPMQRISGDDKKGAYQAAIDGVPAGTLVRFRIAAVDVTGAMRSDPAPNEPRPTYSYVSLINRGCYERV